MENNETKYPTIIPLPIEMPEVIYLKEYYGLAFIMAEQEYLYDMYCTRTFKTKLYKYRKV